MLHQTKITVEGLYMIGFTNNTNHMNAGLINLGYWAMSLFIPNVDNKEKLPYIYVSYEKQKDEFKIEIVGYGESHAKTIKYLSDVISYIRDISFNVGKQEQSQKIMKLLNYVI